MRVSCGPLLIRGRASAKIRCGSSEPAAFISVYGFHLDPETFAALKDVVPGLHLVAWERIREELFKMLLGESFLEAFRWMMRGGVIQRNSSGAHGGEGCARVFRLDEALRQPWIPFRKSLPTQGQLLHSSIISTS